MVVVLTPDGFGKPRNRGEPMSLFFKGELGEVTAPQNLRNPLVQGQKPRNGCVVLGQKNLRRLNQVLRETWKPGIFLLTERDLQTAERQFDWESSHSQQEKNNSDQLGPATRTMIFFFFF